MGEQIPSDIRRLIGDYQSQSDRLGSLQGAQRDKSITKQQKLLKRMKRMLQTYNYSIQAGAYEGNKQTHTSQMRQFQKEIASIDKRLMSVKNNAETQNNLFKHKKEQPQEDMNQREVLFRKGDQVQKEGKDALQRIQIKVAGMEEQGALVLGELDRQINKMDEIYEKMNDTESTLERAEKHLKYFAKQVYTDRILICLLIVIGLAIIVIIILAIAGKTPKQQNGTVG